MIRTVAVVGALLLGMGAVLAEQDAADTLQAAMKDNGKSAGALVAIVKGSKPYDQATVDAALHQLDDTAKKFPALFPDSLKGKEGKGDYSPSPKIWNDKAEFEAHVAAFAKAVTAAKTSVKDVATLKPALKSIGDQCGGCHETFRIKKS